MQTRKILLGFVIVSVLFLILTRRSEGAKAMSNGCRNSISYDQYGNGERTPPLSAKECSGMRVSRGGKCFVAKDGNWKKDDKQSNCPSWVKVVDWKKSNSKARSPLKRPGGYTKYDNKNFDGGDAVLGEFSVQSSSECATKCGGVSGCAGFAMKKTTNSKPPFTCWAVGSARTSVTRKTDNTMAVFVKHGAGGGIAAASTTTGVAAAAATVPAAGVLSACQDVTVYENENFGGDAPTKLGCQTYEGDKLPFVYKGKGDVNMSRLTSMNIPAGMKVYVESPDGGNHTFWSNQRNVGKNWNDQITKLVPQMCNATDIAGGCGVYQDPPRAI